MIVAACASGGKGEVITFSPARRNVAIDERSSRVLKRVNTHRLIMNEPLQEDGGGEDWVRPIDGFSL